MHTIILTKVLSLVLAGILLQAFLIRRKQMFQKITLLALHTLIITFYGICADFVSDYFMTNMKFRIIKISVYQPTIYLPQIIITVLIMNYIFPSLKGRIQWLFYLGIIILNILFPIKQDPVTMNFFDSPFQILQMVMMALFLTGGAITLIKRNIPKRGIRNCELSLAVLILVYVGTLGIKIVHGISIIIRFREGLPVTSNLGQVICGVFLFTIFLYLIWLTDVLYQEHKISNSKKFQMKLELFTEKYQLTARESEVLTHIVKGEKNGQIESTLFISRATLKTHINRIYSKCSVKDRIELLLLYGNFRQFPQGDWILQSQH